MSERKVDPATVAQRRLRVTAGLEELDLWLGDQVRTGLAQTDRSHRAYEAVAARMVDAQAPGVAAALRQIPTTMATRADWPDRVLGEYARLHLLITAHRRLDDLPEALGASVRTHIGYPTSSESVRARPPVRDHWMAVGRRVTEEDRLHTRRTWLLGRATGQWALLVEHSFGTPEFARTVPEPGAMVDAEVHYYPAAAPLRAIWGAQYDIAEPFTTIPVTASDTTRGTVSDALDAHAQALAADPWLRSWPVLLREVVPVIDGERWRVVDATGAAVAVAAAEQPWRLLGVSGGHPVTLVAEWTADGLTPIAALVGGEIVHVVAERGATRSGDGRGATGSGADLTSVALLGTARRTPDPERLPAPVAAAARRVEGESGRALLEYAALRDAFARAGVCPGTATIPSPAPDDERRRLPAPAARTVAAMLRENSRFLAEWFEAARPHDFRAPDSLCALLLEQAAGSTRWRTPLLALAGERGRWLAARHPQWRALPWPAVDAATAGAEVWQYGGAQARRTWLTELRRRDPAAARDMLVATWATESGPMRAELLATFEAGISVRDEQLLESALDDRRADVRRAAAGLLALLPDSAFAGRMLARAATWVRPVRLRAEGTVARTHLVIDIPEPLDAEAIRDGLVDRGVEFSYRWSGAPDTAAGLLRQLVAATPLRHWEGGVAPTPREMVAIGVGDRFRQPLFDGWVDAALAQRDPRWAAALFEAGVPSDSALLRRRELFALLPAADRTRHLLRLDGSWLSEIEALLPALAHPWPAEVAQHLLLLLFDRAGIAARSSTAHGVGPRAHRSLLTATSVHLPVTAAPTVAGLARRCDDPDWEHAFDRLAHDLNHRSMMLEELQ
ncbi:DUF5691 domain-containing protein [Nocardia takedensis]